MHDVRLLLWLRARHARSALNRTLHLVGAGVDDGGWGERAYQLYAVGIMLVWAALMAAALVDAIQRVFVGLAAAVCSLAVQGALLAVALVLLRVGIAGARTTPLKLSHPDIAYLAASAVSARALAGVSAGVQAFAGAAAGAALGFLLGVGLESASVLAGAPAAVALAGAALAAAAVALGWVVGFVRLASDGWSGWRTAAAAFVLVAFAVSWCGVALAAGADALLAPATFAVLSVGGFLVLAVAAIALALLAPRVDMTRVIDENSLHADLCRFGMLSPLDRNDIAEYQRRRKLADRPVRFSLPRGEGRLALVQRAALSHARQYDGLGSLVMQGAFVVPLGVLALLGAGGPVLFVFWLPVAVLMPQGVREATRAFRDDARNRLVRDRLPFGVLELLAFDTLPAFAATTLLACGAVAATLPGGTSLPLALALAVLVGAASLLCCGLDAVRLFPGGPRLCYEYGALALVGVGFALSLFASAAVAAMGMALFAGCPRRALRFGMHALNASPSWMGFRIRPPKRRRAAARCELEFGRRRPSEPRSRAEVVERDQRRGASRPMRRAAAARCRARRLAARPSPMSDLRPKWGSCEITMPARMATTPATWSASTGSPSTSVDRAMPQGSSEDAMMAASPGVRCGVAMPNSATGTNSAHSPRTRPNFQMPSCRTPLAK